MPKTCKSAASKELRGNPGKRPIAEPANLRGIPQPPAALPEEALPEWRRVVKLLSDRGDLSELDQAGLADYCLCRLRLAECEELIGRDGALVPGQRGLVKNPAIQIARQYRSALAKWAELFGLTPASRSRISTPKPEVDDDPNGMFG
jgi:P27 family predicted phage terminase small subunit